ncbi:MAG: hypothetical protein ACYSWU_10045, partial [Planctomycetota bacterium]
MMKSVAGRIAFCTTLASLAIVLACLARPTIGQDKEAAAKPAAAKKAKKFRGRLPNYYGQVVDQKQRATIYKIQAEYAPKIAELKAQLEALTKQRDEKVAAVLTPEQRKKVEQIA